MAMKGLRRVALFGVTAAALALGGCANYVTTQVTAFQNWTASDAQRTYAFERSPAQQNSLEQQAYEQLVDNELSVYGFKLTPIASANFLVALDYDSKDGTVVVQQPNFYDPWGPWGMPYYRPWGPWWVAAPPPPPTYSSYSIATQRLSLRMLDRQTGNEVYRVTATAQVDDPSLLHAMPFLVRGALSDFPLANGTVRRVRVPVDANGTAGLPSNERSVNAAPPAAAPAPAAPAAPAAQ
ncbi:DUF4136 domain-containing protein [Pararobbsia silviterrae]|uniref:DUF4136 domain-containing protein n=1 Tax=Pararobbsia silviterrae TaxID=1792498 RepID=A0A494YAN0_9BURK|nr:DUF4136 domain-containing protein [Pararobbsia silviterrae]RKP59225.1 DUF4136 domain-containing protein [Pararobbsia silviterrae]